MIFSIASMLLHDRLICWILYSGSCCESFLKILIAKEAVMLKSGRNNTIDLVNGPIFSSLIRFSIPILFGSIVTQFYNVADSMIVGRFISSEALAAVSASAPIVSIINLFAIGLSSG